MSYLDRVLWWLGLVRLSRTRRAMDRVVTLLDHIGDEGWLMVADELVAMHEEKDGCRVKGWRTLQEERRLAKSLPEHDKRGL